jgi:hypothetical protein
MTKTRHVGAHARIAIVVALGVGLLAVLTVFAVKRQSAARPAAPPAHSNSAGLSRLQSLPLAAQSTISAALGSDSRGFAAQRSSHGWQLSGGGVRADFRSGEPDLRAGGGRLSMPLIGLGRGDASLPTELTSVSARGNRVTLQGPGIREWYAAGPLGIEQGFTIGQRPTGEGSPLTLALGLNGSLRPQMSGSTIRFLSRSGQTALRYGGLVAIDAAGHRLSSTLHVRGGRLMIGVDDRGARYPVTVDPLVQQSGKLVPTDLQTNGSGSQFGDSVALSADGNTALVGAQIDNSSKGAAWVFTRSGSSWSQQGPKIVPPDELNSSQFGTSVALSADGNTALIGGELDNGQTGAAWVYTRAGSRWTEQQKLLGAGGTGVPQFGHSVALSSDGNTALIGGLADNSGIGAFWFFARSGSIWNPQGGKRVPDVAPMNNNSQVGASVALSSDGNTALIGGPNDGPGSGAAWAWTRSGATWSQQQKLTGSGEASPFVSNFGAAVALSSDGNTAVIGGPGDNNSIGGAAWVFTRSASTWNQQTTTPLIPTNGSGPNAEFGHSVAVSADGNTALIGSQNESNMVGAAFQFTRSGTAWTQQQRLTGTGETGFGFFGSAVALASDGQTAVIGADADTSQTGAAFVFAPPNPVCSSVAATGPQGGGSVAVSLSCTLPSGAHPNYSILGGPSNGSVSGFNASTGQLVYTSAAFFSGEDSLTYRVGDQWGLSNIATATLHIPFLPVPTCSAVTARGKKAATKVTLTLKCQGPKGHPFTYGIVSQPSNGKLGKINQSNGKVTYSTHVGFSGSDRFVYNATNSGGSSKAAVATIVLPRLGRINSTMTWDFTPGNSSTTVVDMLVKTVPGGASVKLSCGKGCPIKSHTAALPKHRVCTGKGKKRKCRMAAPKTGNIDLTRFVGGRHVKVGTRIFVAIVQPGSIGKEYVFRMVTGNQPAVKIVTLAPGSTKPCPSC